MTNQSTAAKTSLLYAWELGGGMGHVAKGVLLAERFATAGIEVTFALREVSGSERLVPPRYPVLQAPIAQARLVGWPAPSDYAELLLHAGFGDVNGLSGRIRAWRTAFSLTGADLLVADHAPTAILAARCAGLRTVVIGPGFFAPPPPWPAFRTWGTRSVEHGREARRRVLATVNQCLVAQRRAPLVDPCELLTVDATILTTWREFDPYPDRAADADYVGPLVAGQSGVRPLWPSNRPRKVFAYLRQNLPGLDGVLQALVALDASVIVHLEAATPAAVARWSSATVTLTSALFRLDDVANEATLVVCSGTETAQAMAARGVPVLGVPMQAEQRLLFMRLQQWNVGRYWIDGEHPAAALKTLADELHAAPVRTAAEALRSHLGAQDVDRTLERITSKVLARLD